MSNNLESEWLAANKDTPKAIQEWWWSFIVEKYNEGGRQAHNIVYLEAKFQELTNIRQKLANINALILALFFQYLNYDPRDADLSMRNIESFQKFANEAGISEQGDLYQAVKLILETSSIYSTEEHIVEGAHGEDDVHYFLDLDMLPLGRSSEEYTEYSNDIAQEYSFLSQDAYKSLRRKVLQSFLLIPNIFSTRIFREKFEATARENILRELDGLHS